jgi:nitrogen fixation protein FixH
MKLLAVLVAVVVLILSAGTIWIGSRAREVPVTQNPYQAGQDFVRQGAAGAADGHDRAHGQAAAAGCELGAGPCQAGLDGGAELWLELSPRPLRTMRELSLEARLSRDGAPVEGAALSVSFDMVGMEMGDNTVQLTAAGGGRYLGKAVLVYCPTGRLDWQAAVAVREGGREARAVLPLRVKE